MHQKKEDGQDVTHLSKVEARAGSRTRVTRNILVISLALIVILFLISLAFGYRETDRTGADDVNPDNTAQTAPNETTPK